MHKRIVRRRIYDRLCVISKNNGKNKNQRVQREGKLEEVEVIKNDFIKEDDLEQSLRAAVGMKRGDSTFQRVLIDGKKTQGI